MTKLAGGQQREIEVWAYFLFHFFPFFSMNQRTICTFPCTRSQGYVILFVKKDKGVMMRGSGAVANGLQELGGDTARHELARLACEG